MTTDEVISELQRGSLIESSRQILLAAQDAAGGFYASPDADRYPYVYPRDCAFICDALLATGDIVPTRRCLEFLINLQQPSGEWLQRYDRAGNPRVSRELETDSTGLMLYAFERFVSVTADIEFARLAWPAVQRGAEFIRNQQSERGLVYSRHSVHESPELEDGFEVWANSWCARGLHDAAKLANRLGDATTAAGLRADASALHRATDEAFWRDGVPVKTIRPTGEEISVADVSMLSPVWAGLVPATDPRARQIARVIVDELWDPALGGYWRFPKRAVVKDWHWYDGGHGPWTFWTLRIARTLAAIGLCGAASDALTWALNLAERGNLPEHIARVDEFEEWHRSDPSAYRSLSQSADKAVSAAFPWQWGGTTTEVVPWTSPLTWAHAELVLTLTTPQAAGGRAADDG